MVVLKELAFDPDPDQIRDSAANRDHHLPPLTAEVHISPAARAVYLPSFLCTSALGVLF
jgi:hypothetical protein